MKKLFLPLWVFFLLTTAAVVAQQAPPLTVSKVCFFNCTTGPTDEAGTLATPEGNLARCVGSTYRKTDGTTNTAMWRKETGACTNTGWVAVSAISGASATYITQVPDSGLSSEQALSTLTSGLLFSTTGTGVLTSRAAPAGAIVGTTDTQSLSNKTLLAPFVTGLFTIAGVPYSFPTSDAFGCLQSDGTGTLTWGSCAGAGGGYNTVADEGVNLTARSRLNFTGAGITCTDPGGSGTNCTVPGGGSGVASYITSVAEGALTNEFALGSLADGLLKNTTTTGIPTIAVAGTDYVAPGVLSTSGLTVPSGFLVGRTTAGFGAPEAITVGSGLSLTGSTLSSTAPPPTPPGGVTDNIQFNDAGAFGGAAIVDCDTSGSKLLYDITTRVFSCGTDAVGAGAAPGGASGALQTNNGAGGFSGFAGAACPAGQVVTAISATGALTCAVDEVGEGGGGGSGGGGGPGTVQSFGVTIDGAGSAITTGLKGFIRVPYSGTISKVTLLSTDPAATVGSAVVDIWKDTLINYAPTVADSITASAKPTLAVENKSENVTLTGWNTTVTAGDIFGFNVESVSVVSRLTVVVDVTPTGGGSGSHTIQDEGISRAARGKLNFIGSTVTCVDNSANDATDCTVSSTPASGTSALTRSVGITIDGGETVISPGFKGIITVPFSGTITKATILSVDAAASTGSIVIDVWKDSFNNYAPTDADSITASDPPTMVSANKDVQTALTGWSTTVTAGDVLAFNVDSVSGLTKALLTLDIAVDGPALGNGGWVLLESRTVASVASINLSTRNAADFTGPTFQSDFDEYVVEFINITPATNGVVGNLRMSTNGGSTYDSGANYSYTWGSFNQVGAYSGGTTGQTQGQLGNNTLLNTGNGGGLNGSARFYNPLSTTYYKQIRGDYSFQENTSSVIVGLQSLNYYNSLTPVNAFQFYFSAGNVVSGTIRVYGISKTGSVGGGPSSGEWSIRFTPLSNNPPAVNSAGFNTRNSTPVLEFDPTVQETAMFMSVVPENYGGGSISVCTHWAAATATTGTIGWDIAFERIGEEIQDLDTDGFGSLTATATTTVPASSGMVKVTCADALVGATLDSLTAGDAFRLRVRRNVAGDDAAGDAQLIAVTLKEP